MNIFRFIADMLHLAAILTLLYRIKVSRNVVGKYPASHPSRTSTQIKQSLSPGQSLSANHRHMNPYLPQLELSFRDLASLFGGSHVFECD
jgi:hypothetical protein